MYKNEQGSFHHLDEDQTTNASERKSNTPNPRDSFLRWIVLIFASFLVFGNDYCYDIPQALENPLKEQLGIDEVKYNLLYSLYSLPNILLPFIGGYILDYFGIKFGVLLYNFLIITGQALFTFGSYTHNYPLLIAGRVLFGTGAESLNVAQSTIVTMWFKGRELTTALGISLCICRLGSSLNSYLSPMLFSHFGNLGHVSFVGLGFTVMSLICGFVLIGMDQKYLKGEKYESSEKIEMSDIKSLNPSFWLMYFNAILCFMSFFPFLNVSNTYLQHRFGLTPTTAGTLLVIPYSVAGMLTPILGILVDRVGKKASLLVVTCLILSLNHFYLVFLPDSNGSDQAILPLVIFGVFFAMYTSLLIPCVSVIAEEKVLGSAMGIVYSGQNTGLTIGPLIVGWILRDETKLTTEYILMSKVLGACAVIAAVDALINWWYDKNYNNCLLQKKHGGARGSCEEFRDGCSTFWC